MSGFGCVHPILHMNITTYECKNFRAAYIKKKEKMILLSRFSQKFLNNLKLIIS